MGLAGLLERNDPDAIVQLAKIWPALGSVPQRSRVLFSLSDSFRDQSAALVRQLAGLVQTSSAELRTAAIAALATIHSREALPVLASLLESADPAERMKGIFGISSFANGCLSQTPDNVGSLAYIVLPASAPYQTAETIANFGFRRGPDDEEARLVSFWSSWLERAPGTSLRFSVVPFAASRGLARCPVRPAVPDLPHDVSAQPVAAWRLSTPELHSLGSKMPHPAPNLSPSLGRSI